MYWDSFCIGTVFALGQFLYQDSIGPGTVIYQDSIGAGTILFVTVLNWPVV